MLITAAEVADTLPGLSPTDAVLVGAVRETDSWAKRSLGRQFARDIYVLYPRGNGTATIWIRESPIRQILDIRIDPVGQFGAETSVTANGGLTSFRFNPDPIDDDSRVTFGSFGGFAVPSHFQGVGWYFPFPEMSGAIQVTVEAGWWMPDDPDHESDLPDALHGPLVDLARVKFKTSCGIVDDETKSVTNETTMRELRHFKR